MLRWSRGRWRRAVRLIILVVTAAFLGLLAWLGYDLAWRIRFQTFASMPISISWAYLALPIGADVLACSPCSLTTSIPSTGNSSPQQ